MFRSFLCVSGAYVTQLGLDQLRITIVIFIVLLKETAAFPPDWDFQGGTEELE